jgi:hypothetical protein
MVPCIFLQAAQTESNLAQVYYRDVNINTVLASAPSGEAVEAVEQGMSWKNILIST